MNHKANFLRLNLLLILFTIFANQCNGDYSLHYFQSKIQHCFKNAPKTWNTYIRMFMYRYLNHNKFQKELCNHQLFHIYKYSKVFMELKDKTLESKGDFGGQNSSHVNVYRTSGHIHISHIPYKYKSYLYSLYFNLNVRIILNITFHMLHLREVALDCNYDKLEVKCPKRTEEKYKYCGYHSNFNLYPYLNEVIIIITLHLRMSFNLNASFSITDKTLIFNPLNSSSMWSGITGSKVKPQYYNICGQYFVTSFFINILKAYQLYIKFLNSNEKNYVIYDGPDSRFNMLNINENKYVYASTFQCFVQFLLSNSSQWYTNNLFYIGKYTMLKYKTTFKWFHPDSDVVIQMPFGHCVHNFCFNKLWQKKGFYFNVTVLNVSVNSHETSSCLFQGLVLGEMNSYHFTAIAEICSKVNNTSSESSLLSFHTRGSSLWIVVYWYNGFTSLNGTISVSVSKCQGIYLNLCSYHHYCRGANEGLFGRFLKEVIGQTKLIFYDCYNEHFKQTFGLQTSECFVLILSDIMVPNQTFNRYQFFMKSVCEINLFSTPGRNQISDIYGSLAEGNYMEVVGYKDCFTSKHRMWNKILKYKPVVEFTQVKLIKRFQLNSLGEINTVTVKFYSRYMKNQVNILLSGVQKEAQQVQYALATHQPGLAISDIMLAVGMQYNIQYGLDWILNIDTNVKLDLLDRSLLCTFNFHRTSGFIFTSISAPFMVYVGK